MGRQFPLYVQIPLLDIPVRMVSKTITGYREALHCLRYVLLSAERSQATANGRNNGRQKRRINRVCGHVAVNCSSIRSGRIVHRIVVRIEAEGNVVRNPEDPVAATNNGLGIEAVGKANSRRHFRSVEGNVSALTRRTDQENVPL